MTPHPNHRLLHGFTLVELLVVIAIIAVVVGLLLPAVQIVHRVERLSLASAETDSLAEAEEAFLISHGSYGTLSELIADGLAPGDLSDGSKHGYQFVIDIDPPPLPEFRIRADPYVPPLSVGFFIDQTQVLRYALDASADAASTAFVDVDSIPQSQAEAALATAVDEAAASFIRELDALPGAGPAIESAIALIATPGLVDAIHAGLDEDDDGEVSIQEFLSGDTLSLARLLVAEQGLADDGTVIAGDALLNAMLADYKMGLDSMIEPTEEPVSPSVPYASGLPGDPVAFLFSTLSSALPALGPLGAVLLVALLMRGARSRGRGGDAGSA